MPATKNPCNKIANFSRYSLHDVYLSKFPEFLFIH